MSFTPLTGCIRNALLLTDASEVVFTFRAVVRGATRSKAVEIFTPQYKAAIVISCGFAVIVLTLVIVLMVSTHENSKLKFSVDSFW